VRRPVLPSGWTCFGLVQHLALDVERFWFRAVVAGQSVNLESGNAAWQVSPDTPSGAVLDLYRREMQLADTIIAETPLASPPTWWPTDLFGDPPCRDLRNTVLHVITETGSAGTTSSRGSVRSDTLGELKWHMGAWVAAIGSPSRSRTPPRPLPVGSRWPAWLRCLRHLSGHRSLRRKDAAARPQTIATHTADHAR
jgi:hypothetical protein